MKQFALLVMLFISTLTFAQTDSTVVSDEITSAERIIDKYSGKAYEAVKELAQALKVPAEHVYTILVKQAVVLSISWTITLVIAIITLLLCIWGLRMGIKEPSEALIIPSIVIGIFSIVAVIGGMAHIDVIVGGFVNPEYYAIKEILNTFK